MSSVRIFTPRGDEDVQSITSRSHRTQKRSESIASSCTVGHEDEAEETFGLFEDEVIDLTNYESDIARPGLLKDGELPLERYRVASGTTLCRGNCIQVRNVQLGAYAVDFVQIQMIALDRTGRYKVRGVPFVRTRKLQGKLPKKLNEVCMILHIQRREDAAELPVLIDVPLRSIVKRRTMIITNTVYPDHSYDAASCCERGQDKERRRRLAGLSGNLVCRWKFKIYFTLRGHTTRPEEEVMERVQSEEVSNLRCHVPDETLCNRWRGGRIKGGSWRPTGVSNHGVVDLEGSVQMPSQARRGMGQRYTMFDSFSGAGGVSRGAQSAGFKVQYAVDKSPEVWETYKANFQDTRLFQMSVDRFIQVSRNRQIRADVLHLSPPCQYFSPAHTHQSVRDDENIFALFGCNEMINKLRPRLVTLEQTFGITHERHRHYLRALIGDFTQFGYSVRWKVVRLCTWGLAQDRKRLIIIAAAPGERLPPFPDPTHSELGQGGLEPFTTIRRAIGGIRSGDDLHNVSDAKHYRPRRAPLDPDRLAGTITTRGSEAYFPDGTRDFTLREYASLQGFPRHHQFIGNRTSIKKQIGNAFAPNTVRVLYKHLENWLLKEDGAKSPQPPADSLVIVDDDSDSAISTPWSGSSELVSSPEMDEVTETNSNTDSRRRRSCLRGGNAFVDLK